VRGCPRRWRAELSPLAPCRCQHLPARHARTESKAGAQVDRVLGPLPHPSAQHPMHNTRLWRSQAAENRPPRRPGEDPALADSRTRGLAGAASRRPCWTAAPLSNRQQIPQLASWDTKRRIPHRDPVSGGGITGTRSAQTRHRHNWTALTQPTRPPTTDPSDARLSQYVGRSGPKRVGGVMARRQRGRLCTPLACSTGEHDSARAEPARELRAAHDLCGP